MKITLFPHISWFVFLLILQVFTNQNATDALRELVECDLLKSRRELTLALDTSQSSNCRHGEKIRKVSVKNFHKKQLAFVNRRNFMLPHIPQDHTWKESSRKNIRFSLIYSIQSTVFTRPCIKWFPSFFFHKMLWRAKTFLENIREKVSWKIS